MKTYPFLLFLCILCLTGCATTGADRETAEANAYVAGMVTGAILTHQARDDAQPHRTLKEARQELRNSRTLIWLSLIEVLFKKP